MAPCLKYDNAIKDCQQVRRSRNEQVAAAMANTHMDKKGHCNKALLIQCFLYKKEDLNSGLSTSMERIGHIVVLSANPSPGVVSE